MTHINQRRDTSANWTSANPVLQLGEVGWETDTRRGKLGDGVSEWDDLDYINPAGVLSVNSRDGDVVLTKIDVGLGSVDNTDDLNKPVSGPVQNALDEKVDAAGLSATIAAAINAAIPAAILASYPVGAIYMSTDAANPSTFIGGSWSAWGAGRVPVGLDTGDSDFNASEETGGAKTHTLTASEIPAHSHPMRTYATAGAAEAPAVARLNVATANTSTSTNPAANPQTGNNAGGGGAHNNLQPYIVCYMWKRTA